MIRRLWADLLYVVLALAVLGWVAWDAFGFRLITYSPGADYWEHTAVLRALLDDPWHPKHPLIVSSVGSPRFGPHFLALALVGRALGWGAITTMSLAAVVNTLLVLIGIRAFFRSYFRDPRAPIYGLVVFFGSWFDAPHFSNVYKLKVFFSVAGYPSSAALGVTLLGLALLVRILRGRLVHWSWLALSALVWGYVYVTHPLTATMGLPAAVLLALTEPYVPRGLRLRVAGSVAVGLLLTLLWPYYPALGMVVGGTVERVKDADPEELGALHRFYAPRELLDILGFCLISLLALPYLWVRRLDVFAVLGSLLMLGVFALSALVPIPLGHRYVLLSVFFLQIALVRVLLELTPAVGARRWASRGLWRWPVAALVGVLLVSAAAWNVWVAREHFMRTAESGHFRPGSDSVTVRYARRVSEIAGRRAVVLSTALASWPLPTFGPKIVAPHHSNPLIVDTAERRRAAILFFAPHASPAERRAIVARYGVTHVVLPPRAPGAVGDYLERLAKRQVLPGGYSIFALSP